MKETRRRTLERFERRHRQFTGRGRKRSSIETPLFQRSLRLFLKPVADAIERRLDTAPSNLIEIVGRMNPYELATIVLAQIMDGILWGLRGNERSKRATYQAIGQYLKDRLEFAEINVVRAIARQIPRGRPRAENFLREEWPAGHCVLAGWWLVDGAIESKYFIWRGNRLIIAPEYEGQFKRLRQELSYAEPYHMPHLSPPADWTGWRKHYDCRISAKFIRGWRTDQRQAIAGRLPFPHADAVDHRKRVALRINQAMLPIVDKFAADCMGHTGWKRLNDQNTVEGDLRDATWIGDRTFYLDYSCDERGRMYALQRFSYDREDHVRSLIEFDHGVYCGPYGIQWLEINCATLYGVDKLILGERLQWAGKKRSFIRAVARDPIGTLDRWRGADRPLQFVRSCIELVDAYDNPDHLTRLPIGIDATASGLQHLALLCRDFKTMEQVNLTLWHNRVMDIYDRVAARVQASIQGDSHEWAAWWLKRLEELGDKRRKLFKGPVSTFSYASTEPSWNKQIRDAYDELERLSEPLPRDSDGNLIKRGDKSAVGYLVDEVRLACEAELPGPSAVMQWLKDRVSRQYDRNTFVSWDSPSGFPCRNLEETPNLVEVNLPGQRRKIIVADGVLPEMDLEEMLKSITANFTHSLDAAHAARTINALVGRGITSIITCHDCFYSYAPFMYDVRGIALAALRDMYQEHDPLHELWLRNGADGDPPPKLMDDGRFFELLKYLPNCEYAIS